MQSQQELKNISPLSKKKRKKYDKIVLLRKDRLNTIEILVSKALIDSYISHDKLLNTM